VIVHVWGASGYAAAEFVAYFLQSGIGELGALESASHSGERIGAHFPRLRGLDRVFDPPGTIEARIVAGDAVVLAGPHGAARTLAPKLVALGARVIDLSDDFRHPPTPAVYGLPERYREAISRASLVANPGCYPTATLLATLPLAQFAPAHIVVDAKSGITGAGRTPATGSLFAEVDGEVRPYGLTGHRHEPEIVEQWQAAGIDCPLIFTPHVVPLSRGMLVNVYAALGRAADAEELRAAFEAAYSSDSTVRVLDDAAPSLRAVEGTRDAELHVSLHGNVARVICAIDNLGRGAAGTALTNLEIMYAC
jgi:N-acetyl-gamma-glutamyl-phosphate reductase